MNLHKSLLIVGAGPIGLAAAANAIERDIPFKVIEAGSEVGTSVRTWGHVRLFSPWKHCIDPASRRILKAAGWIEPANVDLAPSGNDLINNYLVPLAAHPQIAANLLLDTSVVSISKAGGDKTRPEGRDQLPFVVHAVNKTGEIRLLASAVIDASGTWSQPNPVGAGGVPAVGESDVSDLVSYGIPDVFGVDRTKFVGKNVAVLGSGHSAQNIIRWLAELANSGEAANTKWIVRRDHPGNMFGGQDEDELPDRGALGADADHAVSSGAVELVTGFSTYEISRSNDSVWLTSTDGRKVGPLDQVIAATGSRPNLAMLRELRTSVDPALESVAALSALIDPNFHSCGSVAPHGARELKQPEKDFYVVGNKSYGRAPTFLLLTGYEQARSVVAAIDGDAAAAEAVELQLPETGVCSVDLGSTPSGGLTILQNGSCC